MDTYDKRLRIRRQLIRAGISYWGLQKTETRYLTRLLFSDEIIGGVTYGHNKEGSVMLVATSQRVLYIDVKPMFKKVEDINYDNVAGITLNWIGLAGTIVLHTGIGDISVRTMNRKAANIFRNYIEKRCLSRKYSMYPRHADNDTQNMR